MLKHRLRRLRLQRGWNVEELARRAGVSRTTMYLLEKGITATPRAKTLQQIARTLDVPVEELAPEWTLLSDDRIETGNVPSLERTYERAINRSLNNVVETVYEAHPQLFLNWSQTDWDELYGTFGVGGALTPAGVLDSAEKINRRRTVAHQLQVVLETEHAETAVRLIQALYQLALTQPLSTAQDPNLSPRSDRVPANVTIKRRPQESH
ncbi:MAG: helix-turn-helix transcriptional regulator [Planctomycetaceae bacterium]